MDMVAESLAKKYARAWVNLYSDKLDAQLVENIDILSDYLYKNRTALFYVQLTALDNDGTKKNFEQLLDSFHVGKIFQSLIELLLFHKRIALLPSVMRYIYRLYLEKKNIMHFMVESPVELTKDELVSLKVALSAKTGKNTICHTEKKPELIAGLKVYSETLGFNKSLQKELQLLSRKNR